MIQAGATTHHITWSRRGLDNKAHGIQALEDVSEAAFFDPRVSLRPSVRGRRAFNFHEPGKFQQVAARMRTKAQLEKLQVRLAGRLVWLFFLYLTPFYSQLTGVRIGHYCINTS